MMRGSASLIFWVCSLLLLLSVSVHSAPCASLFCPTNQRCYFNTATGVENCRTRCANPSPQACLNGGTCSGSGNSSACVCTALNDTGNFCEYPLCYAHCNYLGITSCTGNTTVGTCTCQSQWSGTLCTVYRETELVYNYLLLLWNGDVPAMPTSYCASTVVNTVDSSTTLTVVCNGGGNITSLAFVGGAYEFPRTFGALVNLATISFTYSKLIRIDANIKYLPTSIRTLTLTNVQIPSNLTSLALSGNWGAAGAALTTLSVTGDSFSFPDVTLGSTFGAALTNLATLSLSNVQGTLPASVWSMTLLRSLTVISGGLTGVGQAPAAANWTLNVVNLSDNDLSMTFLALMSRLPSGGVKSVSAALNSLTGNLAFPSSWSANLTTLSLESNYMTGALSIPSPTIIGHGMTLLKLANNLFSCPVLNYTSLATTTDYSSTFVTACSSCTGTCTHSGTCSMPKTTDVFTVLCACPAGFYGTKCQYTKSVYVDLYNLNAGQYDVTLPFCSNTNVACDSDGNVVGLTFVNSNLSPEFYLYTPHVTSLTLSNFPNGSPVFAYLPPNLINLTMTGCADFTAPQEVSFTVPSLRSLVITNPTHFLSLELRMFPGLTNYHFSSSGSLGSGAALTKYVFNHPTLKTVYISGGGWDYIYGAALAENTVIEELSLRDADRLPFAIYSLADLLVVLPSMPSLKKLDMAGFLSQSTLDSSPIPSSFSKIMPSQYLDLTNNNLGGSVPTLLSAKKSTLRTLLLDGNNGWAQPLANYTTWATTTDFSSVFGTLNSTCASVTCAGTEKCITTGDCLTPAELLGISCLNGATIGPAPTYTCLCATGYSGPSCGFPNPQQEKIYNWARRAQYVKWNSRASLCGQDSMSCSSGMVTDFVIRGMNGPFLMPSDMEGLPYPSSTADFAGFATNSADFFASGIILNGYLRLAVEYSSPIFSNVWNIDAPQVTLATTYDGENGTYVLDCNMMALAHVNVDALVNFNLLDCHSLTNTLNFASDGVFLGTYDQLSAYYPHTSAGSVHLNDDGVGPVGTASYQIRTPVLSITIGDPDAIPYADQLVVVKRSSFPSPLPVNYTNLSPNAAGFLCPVYDYSQIATSSNHATYDYSDGNLCVFCRAVSCASGQYCNPYTATCQAPATFCDFPQCQNGGTCNGDDSSCTCAPGFGGAFCEIEYTCTCDNNGTCNADHTCTCPAGYRGDRCQTHLSDGGIAGIVIGAVAAVVLVVGLAAAAASMAGGAGAGAASSSGGQYYPMKTM